VALIWFSRERRESIPHKRTVKQKLFASFLLAIAVPLLLSSVIASAYILMQEVQKRKEQLVGVSESISLIFSDRLKKIDQYVYGLSATPWIETLMHSQHELFDYRRFDPIEVRNHSRQIFVTTILNPFVLTMVLVLNERDVVFSGGGYLSTLADYLEMTYDMHASTYSGLREAIAHHTTGSIVFPVKRSTAG
jgi:hypothetical protein